MNIYSEAIFDILSELIRQAENSGDMQAIANLTDIENWLMRQLKEIDKASNR